MEGLDHVTVGGISGIVGLVLGGAVTAGINVYAAWKAQQRADRGDAIKEWRELGLELRARLAAVEQGHRDCVEQHRRCEERADTLQRRIDELEARIKP